MEDAPATAAAVAAVARMNCRRLGWGASERAMVRISWSDGVVDRVDARQSFMIPRRGAG